MLILFALLLQADSIVLDNAYVRVTRGSASCSSIDAPICDRVVVALSDIRLRTEHRAIDLKRGEIAVFRQTHSYEAPYGGTFFQVMFKPNHPPVESPREMIRPAKNAILFENDRYLIFEERLAVGDTRPRHSHGPRVVIQLNRTKLQQWPDGEAEVVRDIEPERPTFNAPVIHTVKNVGARPLRGIVLELKRTG